MVQLQPRNENELRPGAGREGSSAHEATDGENEGSESKEKQTKSLCLVEGKRILPREDESSEGKVISFLEAHKVHQ